MWCVYEESYDFRDCFDVEQIQGEITAINKIIETGNKR